MLSSSRRIAVLLAAASLAGPVGPALAQPTGQKQDSAKDLTNKAIAKSRAGDHAAAIKLYKEAYDLEPNPLVLPNIGGEYRQLEQWEEALKYFCRYLKEDPGGLSSGYARSQAKLVQRLLGRKKIDSKDPCAPPPPEDDPDERPSPTDDTSVPRHPVKTRNPVSPEPPDQEGGPGTVPPIQPPKPTTEGARAASSTPVLMYAGLAAGIAGLAAGGIGVYYGIQGKSISDLVNSHPKDQPWPDDIRKKMADGERDNRLQVSYLIASGVLVTAGVVLYVVGRPDATEHASDKTVRVVPTANGAVVFGRF